MTTYSERLRDPRWQRRRLDILNRADFRCSSCDAADKTLHVHHRLYRKGAAPWEYSDDELVALCEDCHGIEHRWRSLLSEAAAKLNADSLEYLVGYAEGLACRFTNEFPLPLRSMEHAEGMVAGLGVGPSGLLNDWIHQKPSPHTISYEEATKFMEGWWPGMPE